MFCNVSAGSISRAVRDAHGTITGARSVVAAASYRSGDRLHDARAGKTYDYGRKGGIEGTAIFAPAEAEWAQDRARLWNGVEAGEKRKDAQLAKDLLLIHPQGSTLEQRERVTEQFARRHFVAQGFVVDAAHHAPDAREDRQNPHTHLLIPYRRADAAGFCGRKNVGKTVPGSFDSKETVATWQRDFKELWNAEFAQTGQAIRFDLRSNRERGLETQPKRGIPWHRLKRDAARQAGRGHSSGYREAAAQDLREHDFAAVWEWDGHGPAPTLTHAPEHP